MSYVIESGIPAPAKMQRHIKPKSALRVTLESLKPGQSVLLDTPQEYDQARSASTYIPGEFVFRKVRGQGWRAWRLA